MTRNSEFSNEVGATHPICAICGLLSELCSPDGDLVRIDTHPRWVYFSVTNS
jgi:hypothetical protein